MRGRSQICGALHSWSLADMREFHAWVLPNMRGFHAWADANLRGILWLALENMQGILWCTRKYAHILWFRRQSGAGQGGRQVILTSHQGL